ncbi:MAG: MarR family transcriptional regulator [Rhizobiaceae bacterium]|nr:MarR family transcriptional regulator [Rhizobiaceae bacterium]
MTGEDKLLKLVEADEGPQVSYALEEQVGFLLRRAHQRHVSIFAAHVSELTPPQFAALVKLRDAGETSQNQLGTLVAMDAATIKGVIDRLKLRGLVELGPSGTDRRRLMVSLTDEGRRTVEALIPAVQQGSEETLAPLSPRDAATLVRLLAKIA